ncbi:MAG: CBS domain-containing protein [Thermomicrobiales bacterium]
MADPTVADLMRVDFPTLAPDDSIASVARQIAGSGLPGLPVMEDGEIIGIITEADIISREAEVDVPAPSTFLDAIFSIDVGRDFDDELRRVVSVTARELMSHPVYNILQTATLSQAATLMIDRKVNPVPVVDNNHSLVGIVSRADLVRVIARLEGESG